MPRYQINRPIKHGGRIVKKGMVELEVSVAVPLLKSNALSLMGESSADSSQDLEQDDKIGHIAEVIARLDGTDESLWTKSGKPDVKALETILNEQITAADRDQAWDRYNASLDNGAAE